MRAIMRGSRRGAIKDGHSARYNQRTEFTFLTPNITLQPSLKSGLDQSRLHASRILDILRFSSRLNSVVRRDLEEELLYSIHLFVIYE